MRGVRQVALGMAFSFLFKSGVSVLAGCSSRYVTSESRESKIDSYGKPCDKGRNF